MKGLFYLLYLLHKIQKKSIKNTDMGPPESYVAYGRGIFKIRLIAFTQHLFVWGSSLCFSQLFINLAVREWQKQACGYHGDYNDLLAAAIWRLFWSWLSLHIKVFCLYCKFLAWITTTHLPSTAFEGLLWSQHFSIKSAQAVQSWFPSEIECAQHHKHPLTSLGIIFCTQDWVKTASVTGRC